MLLHYTKHFNKRRYGYASISPSVTAHAQPTSGPTTTYAALQELVEDGFTLVEVPAEQQEVRAGFGHFKRLVLVGLFLEPCGGGLAGFAQVLDTAQLLVGVFEGGQCGGLSHGGQVVRHTYDTHAVDDALGRGQVATCAPAKAKALLMVRLTAKFGWSLIRLTALGVPGLRNSTYASSMTRIGCTPSPAPTIPAAAFCSGGENTSRSPSATECRSGCLG